MDTVNEWEWHKSGGSWEVPWREKEGKMGRKRRAELGIGTGRVVDLLTD